MAALRYIELNPVHLVISDYRMPLMDGATLLAKVREIRPDAARLVLSACVDRAGAIRAINEAGVDRIVEKPWMNMELRATILATLADRVERLEMHRFVEETRSLRGMVCSREAELRRLEAESPGITKVRWSEDGGVLLEP
jgi:two-component system, probable response regulator PhcQ